MNHKTTRFHGMFGILLGSLISVNAYAVQVLAPVVDAVWLSKNLNQVVILDVRTEKDSFKKRSRRGSGPVNPCGAKAGQKAFHVSGHIPGAKLILWKKLFEERKLGDVQVKYLVPSQKKFEKLMQKAGVNNDSAIVITSNGVNLGDAPLTTRLYWMLKYFGHDNVAILDGGTAKWIQDTRKIKYSKSKSKRGNFKVSTVRSHIRATTKDVVTGTAQLIDARGHDMYLGLSYPAKFVPAQAAGHIPNAKNFPLNLMVNSADLMTTFYKMDKIAQVAALKNIKIEQVDTIFYCNTGAYSSLAWFVWHELLGNKKARLYDGSMHEWSRDANRPVSSMIID
ncbi:MAG: sulfurtransferase [Thiomargarita sp.]|nr:sulfurtransferase [Thiomargarita sp.]